MGRSLLQRAIKAGLADIRRPSREMYLERQWNGAGDALLPFLSPETEPPLNLRSRSSTKQVGGIHYHRAAAKWPGCDYETVVERFSLVLVPDIRPTAWSHLAYDGYCMAEKDRLQPKSGDIPKCPRKRAS